MKRMKVKGHWLVAIDGSGEDGADFCVLVLKGYSAQEVVERITSPEWGYGKDQDGIAYVTPLDQITTFTINSTQRKHVLQSPTMVDMPQFNDPDGILLD